MVDFVNVLGALGFPTGQNAGIELVDANGKKQVIVANATTGVLQMGRGGANSFNSMGAAELVTIAGGVATVTRPFVRLAAQTGTADQLDSIVYTGVQEGDMLILTADTGDTITVDDGSIDLTATAHVLVGPSHFLTLIYNGAGWSELSIALGDNA